MSKSNGRTFNIEQATRQEVPLLVGISGPSGSGKSFSAQRLAAGMRRIVGGKVVAIDSESRRMLHYADDFDFLHMPFEEPFGPLDYLAALEAAVDAGAKVAIVDSGSHEHEGPGGVLEMHDEKTKELARKWKVSMDKAQFSAWGEPKSQHRRLVNRMLQLPIHTIWCFRAKEKLKPRKGQEPESMGWMPIISEDMIYEMTVSILLPPASDGVPDWNPDGRGARRIFKKPKQFRDLFRDGQQLNEDIGEALAKWAAGDEAPKADDAAVDKARTWFGKNLPKAETDEHVAKLEKRIAKAPASVQAELRSMCEARRAELSGGSFDDEDPFDNDEGNEPPANVVQWGDDEDTPITDLSIEQLTVYHDDVQAEAAQDDSLEPHLEQVRAEITRRQRAEAAAE